MKAFSFRNGNKDKYKTLSLPVLSRSPFHLLNLSSLRIPEMDSVRYHFGSRCLSNASSHSYHQFSAARHQELWSCPETAGDSLFCIDWVAPFALNTTISSFSLGVTNWPVTSHFSWTCPPVWVSYLPAKYYTRHIHFTNHLWYAAGFLERDETGYNVNTDDRPSNTVTLFKQACEVFPLLQF